MPLCKCAISRPYAAVVRCHLVTPSCATCKITPSSNEPRNKILSMLTVILSNYNHARFLPHALNALFAQSRPAEEIILIDDASTDGSVAVIEAHLSRHPNIRLVRNPKNSWRHCQPESRSPIGARKQNVLCGSRRHRLSGLVRKSLALLDRYPRAALCSSRCDIIGSEGCPRPAMVVPMPRSSPGYIEPSDVARQLMRDDSWFMGPTTLWHREPLFAIGGFPEELGAFTDGYVSRLLALQYGACFSPEVLAAWRRMSGGMAWSQTMSADAGKFTQLVERKMAEASGVFPPGYAERWKRRYVFSARRFALVQERHATCSKGLMRWVVAVATEMFLTTWLFMKLRPFDLVAVVRRRLQHVLRR